MGIGHRQSIIKFLASGFYAGYSPLAPGTAGSLVGALAYLFLQYLPDGVYVAIILLVFLAGIYIAGMAEEIYQEKDSPHIVIDEVAGMLLTFIFLPGGIYFLLAGFIAFRIFDILKPFPIRMIDRNLDGGWGIMLDDIFAALYANGAVRLLGWIMGWI